MSNKYLDYNGVLYFWQKIKATFAKASHTHTTADVTGLDAALTNANKVTDVKVNGTSVVTNKSANITVDSTLSTTSNNPIKNSTVAAKFNSVDSAISGKQNKLTFDSTPTADSTNPVTSGGVKSALDAKQNKLTFDSTPQGDSYNPVYSDGIYTALAYKQDELTFDSTPTANSSNPVTSGGVKTAIDAVDAKFANKQNAIPNADKLSIDSSGIIAAKNLPSYVDDVVEVCTYNEKTDDMIGSANWFRDPDNRDTVISGEKGKVYIVVGAYYTIGPLSESNYKNTQWRWTGSQYVQITDGSLMSPIQNQEIDAILSYGVIV